MSQFVFHISNFFLTASCFRNKEMETVKSEIQAVIRQITSTVTFLPLLEAPCKWKFCTCVISDILIL